MKAVEIRKGSNLESAIWLKVAEEILRDEDTDAKKNRRVLAYDECIVAIKVIIEKHREGQIYDESK